MAHQWGSLSITAGGQGTASWSHITFIHLPGPSQSVGGSRPEAGEFVSNGRGSFFLTRCGRRGLFPFRRGVENGTQESWLPVHCSRPFYLRPWASPLVTFLQELREVWSDCRSFLRWWKEDTNPHLFSLQQWFSMTEAWKLDVCQGHFIFYIDARGTKNKG